MKSKLIISLMALTLLFGGLAQADVLLTSTDLNVGVNNAGALCSLALGQGITYTGPGAQLPNDFTIPGTPWEFYSIGVAGGFGAFGTPGFTALPAASYSTANFSTAVQQVAHTSGGAFVVNGASLQYSQTVNIANAGPLSATIYVSSDIINDNPFPISNVVFARGMDPDQDNFKYGLFVTNNFFVPGGVEAVGPISHMYVKLINNSVYPFSAAISGPYGGPWTTNPYAILVGGLINGAVPGNPLDYSINMAWNIGTLGPFQSAEIDYYYTFGVPLPPSVLLLGSGLLGLLGLRRFRKP